MRTFIAIILLSIFSLSSFTTQSQGLSGLVKNNAQAKVPVNWKTKVEKISESEFKLIFIGTANKPYHYYSQYTQGTMPMAFYYDSPEGYKTVGKVSESPKPKEEYDELLGGMTKYWDGTATFTQKIVLTKTGKVKISGAIEYQACIEGMCTVETFNFNLEVEGKASTTADVATETAPATQAVEVQQKDTNTIDTSKVETNSTQTTNYDNLSEQDWLKLIWEPVTAELNQLGNKNSVTDKSFLIIFILGFLGGLIALMTPCVWPMIPMTVSFFIKKDKAKGKRDAIIYGLSIVVIFMALALGITAAFGADALNAMSTSAVFNVIFFVILVVFAASFLGAFEMVLPTKWTNKVDAKADSTTGLVSIFLMAFTLVLVSFSCTGPIVGTLLVEAVTKGIWGPAFGMLGFSIALALPFTLFAFFPSMMKSMPKSGGWLNTVKVVLGFLELALALKFLSVADMAYHWRILDREVFLVLWIVIFTLLGMYLLGKLMFSHDSKVEKIGVFRLFLAMISLSFALYMVPGLWGAPLKAISAFSPPQSTQDFDLYDGTVHAKFDNYEEGMAYAREKKLPVLVDFTGHGCVNCRNMENAVWQDAEVKEMLEKDYVLISLYVDDKTPLPAEKQRVSTFSGNKIRNVGNLWSDLQIGKFGQSSQPYYFPIDYNGKPLTSAEAYNLDINNYKKFLKKGILEFKKKEEAK